MDKAADDGAFVDLEKYYDKSTLMQKCGHQGPRRHGAQPRGPALRHARPQHRRRSATWSTSPRGDFWSKYGKMPTTVEEWVDFLRWDRRRPTPTPSPSPRASARDNIWWCGESFFLWYGLRAVRLHHPRRQAWSATSPCPSTSRPSRIYHQSYAEGIYDKEFMSNQATNWVNKIYGKDVVLWSYMNYQIAFSTATPSTRTSRSSAAPATGGYFITAPKLTKFPACGQGRALHLSVPRDCRSTATAPHLDHEQVPRPGLEGHRGVRLAEGDGRPTGARRASTTRSRTARRSRSST